MNLFLLQTEVKCWSEYNFPNNRRGYQPLLGAVEEIGELAHAHLKEEQGIRKNGSSKAAKMDAIGDVIIYLADYCARNDLCLGEAVRLAWEEVKQRDWVKFPKNGRTE